MAAAPEMVLHLWCSPRSLSTCTMYSFAQRPDCVVLDEPLYAHWLLRNPEAYRPYRQQLLEQHNTDGEQVLKQMHSPRTDGKKIVVAKHIVKQFAGLDFSVLENPNNRHLLIIRDPLDVLLAWNAVNEVHKEDSSHDNMGLPQLVQLYLYVKKSTGQEPIIVDSEILKKYPKGVLRAVCSRLGIQFYEEQLRWTSGPKPYDGLWASYWYESVHKSTGYDSNGGIDKISRYSALSPLMVEFYRECLPFFDMLRRKAIGVDPLNPGSSGILNSNDRSGVIVDHGIPTKVGVSSANSNDLPAMATIADERNKDVLVWVGDRLLPRELAKVSVFDSAVQGGDAVWEGLRVYNNAVFRLHEHVHRLLDSAKAMAFENVPTKNFILKAIAKTLLANGMQTDCHMRLTLSRGAKVTSSMNPKFNIFGCNLLIVPEWKPVGDAATYDNNKGIKLITATNRRNPPQCVDSRIHHNNLINNILPKIQANNAGAADALMLDMDGFVAETNATNVFMVKNDVLHTPTADACLPGITRSTVMRLASELGIVLCERRISLAEFQCADEVFTTGTMGSLETVYPGPVTARIQAAYRILTVEESIPLSTI